MQKTGEAYTTARAHLLQKNEQPRPADYAKLAGMSDSTLEAKTGCTWERWVKGLDRVEAYTWPHRRRAAATGMKRYWEKRLAALQQVLVPAP
jgi:hypothetical protein